MKKFVAIVPKSPLPRKGRIGPDEIQDWYALCVVASNFSRANSCPIFISSAFKIGEWSEADHYRDTLKKINPQAEVIVRHEGWETVGNLDAIFSYAKKSELKPKIISTFSHKLRVEFICQRYGCPYEHHSITIGRNRTREAITDVILTFVFPAINYLRLEKAFLKKIIDRRKTGKF
jgi:hypothetical protein